MIDMTNTVTLYEWENLRHTPGWEDKKGFSMERGGSGGHGFIVWDHGNEYILPEGYELAESNMGTLEIYDNHGNHCEIGTLAGQPTLISLSGRVVLQRLGN